MTKKILIDEDKLKLALEALENSVDLVIEDAHNAEQLYGSYPTRQGKVGGLKILAEAHKEAITALRQAIEQAEKQEPVAWLSKGGKGIWFHEPDASLNATPLYTEPQRCPNCDSLERQNAVLDLRLAEQDQPPFGYLTNKRQRVSFEPNATGLSNMPMTIDWKIPVYGSPQPQRQPLTDEEIAYATAPVFMGGNPSLTAIARAIEAAHGIKGEA